MNVLQVNTVYPHASTGRIAAQIAAHTAVQPDSRALVAFGIGEPSHGNGIDAIRIGSPLERKFHGALRKLLDGEGYGSWFATGRLIRFCRDSHADVVHLHNLHGCYLNLKRWFRYLEKADLPVVWTLHDSWPVTGHCAFFSLCGCERWKTLCRRCPHKHVYPECVGIDGSKRNYSLKRKLFTGIQNLTLVAPCEWMRGIVEASYLKNVPVRVIYNSVDTRQFRPFPSNLRGENGLENKRVLLAVASVWNDHKGLDALACLSEMLDESYRVVILGLTREQVAALPSSVLGLERTSSRDALAAWYSVADCFVNPTLDDTMPLVNLEALACGTPVVTYDTGGCPEAITPACGLVAARGDIRGLRDAVKQICESGADYTDACLMQAKRFSVESMVRSYIDLYREVIS